MSEQTVDWNKLDTWVQGLDTDQAHNINVQREAVPIIFLPGIMGSRLKLTGTDEAGTGADGLPNLRWDPSSSWFMFNNYSGATAIQRRKLLIGSAFNQNFLDVANATPVGDGFAGIMSDYTKFLNKLKTHDWGAVGKIFELPVFAFGYNWTDSAQNAGTKLAARIQEIMAEAKKTTGKCERVIVVTHSMGGLVGRSSCMLSGAASSVLGVVHGVQPTNGAGAGYWRVKAGFEGLGETSRILGHDGPQVTVILGNSPGGLQLLPNQNYRTNSGSAQWLTITKDGAVVKSLPQSNPYSDIYRIKAVVKGEPGKNPSNNNYWGLIDPTLLNPREAPSSKKKGPNDALAAAKNDEKAWNNYLSLIGIAEDFHSRLSLLAHPKTFCLAGKGYATADHIELSIESNWVRSENYPNRGFRGFFTDAAGKDWQAVLQDAEGSGGDGTVPLSSSTALDDKGRPAPGDTQVNVEHQPAYEDDTVQKWAMKAILALLQMRYKDQRGH